VLNANVSVKAKATNFKFGKLAPRESPDMTLDKILEQEAWLESHDLVNFWGLNANSSIMTESND